MQLTTAQIAHCATLAPHAARAYLRECHMTPEERERFFYVEGRIAEAAAVGAALDEENDALDELRHDRDQCKEEADRLERENEDLQAAVEAAEEKVLTLTSDLENAQDEIETLKTRVLELESPLA